MGVQYLFPVFLHCNEASLPIEGKLLEPFWMHFTHFHLKVKFHESAGNIKQVVNPMKKSITLCLIFLCGVMPVLSKTNFESVPPGNWAKVKSLSQGLEISLKMKYGDKMKGEYKGLDEETIRIKLDGEEKVYPKKDVSEIYLTNVRDSNSNGTLIGFGIGAALLGTYGGIAIKDNTNEGGIAAAALVGAGIGGGIGALIGYVADDQHKGRELIYRASNNK